MTVTRLQLSQTYIQDEHQRVQQSLADNITQMQTQIAALQAAVTAIKKQLGIK